MRNWTIAEQMETTKFHIILSKCVDEFDELKVAMQFPDNSVGWTKCNLTRALRARFNVLKSGYIIPPPGEIVREFLRLKISELWFYKKYVSHDLCGKCSAFVIIIHVMWVEVVHVQAYM